MTASNPIGSLEQSPISVRIPPWTRSTGRLPASSRATTGSRTPRWERRSACPSRPRTSVSGASTAPKSFVAIALCSTQERVELPLCAFVYVDLARARPGWFRPLRLSGPKCRKSTRPAGPYCYLLKVRAAGTRALQHFLYRAYRGVPARRARGPKTSSSSTRSRRRRLGLVRGDVTFRTGAAQLESMGPSHHRLDGRQGR